MTTSKEIQISTYLLGGVPKVEEFHCVEVEVANPKQNEIVVKNIWMSVDPYMRGCMIDRKSYIAPFKLNTALEGGAIGVVEESLNPKFKPGDYVMSMKGWRECYTATEDELTPIPATKENCSLFLGPLGMPGLTAYSSLQEIGKLKAGETIFVSAASGAVGSLVCQIAKLKDCKVIASAGSDEKTKWLEEEAKVDAAFNYKTCASIDEKLAQLAPKGIDVYFESVGGEHLQAAINAMNPFGRIIMCGMISQYNNDQPSPGPNNLIQIIGKSITMQGFIVFNYQHLQNQFIKDMSTWIEQGKIKVGQTCLEGIESAPEAFLDLFSGKNIGKMLVKIA